MTHEKKIDLRDLLSDAHVLFFRLIGEEIDKLRLWEIRENCLIIDLPTGGHIHKQLYGFVPTIDGSAIYEVEGEVQSDLLPDQNPDTIRITVNPEKIKKINRRVYPRYSFAPPLSTQVKVEGEKKELEGRLINLSAGGVRLESEEKLPSDKPLTLNFQVPFGQKSYSFSPKGHVIYELPMELGFAYGIQFLPDEASDENAPEEVSEETLQQSMNIMRLVEMLLGY